MIFVSLNETIIPSLLYWMLRRKELYLVDITPIFRHSARLLEPLANLLLNRRYMKDVCDLALVAGRTGAVVEASRKP